MCGSFSQNGFFSGFYFFVNGSFSSFVAHYFHLLAIKFIVQTRKHSRKINENNKHKRRGCVALGHIFCSASPLLSHCCVAHCTVGNLFDLNSKKEHLVLQWVCMENDSISLLRIVSVSKHVSVHRKERIESQAGGLAGLEDVGWSCSPWR